MKNRASIRKQLQMLGVMPVIVMLVLLMVMLTWQRFNDAGRELEESGNFLAQQIALSAEYGVLAGNGEDLRRQAELALSRAELRYVVFRDQEGHVLLYESRGVRHQEKVREFRAGIYRQPFLTGNEVPNDASSLGVSARPERIGEVLVGMSTVHLQHRQREILLASFLPALLTMAIGLLVANYLARQVANPLGYLSGRLRAIRGGEYSVPVAPNMAGEFGELQGDINELAASLQRAQTQQREAIHKLQEAHQKAQLASQAKSDFLAMMSHELRTPMNGVLGTLQLLEATEQTPEQTEYSRAALESTVHLLDVINDILDFSRIEARRMELDPVFFELRPVLDNCLSTFRYAAKKKGLYLKLVLEGEFDNLHVRSDPLRFRQVLNNLISNAVKFTHDGGVTVRVLRRDVGDEHVDLQVTVEDTGIGIPEEKREALFSAFSQLDSSTSRRFGGTGLGLAIARRLSEMLGGVLSVENNAMGGCDFVFSLRLWRQHCEDAEGESTDTPAEREPLLTGLVLLVEDNDVNLLVARRLLEQLGVTVITANHGEEALEIVKQRDVDCILMDVQMPVMDGVTATRHLRQWEREQARDPLPVIALTANAMSEEKERCMLAGMDAHLAKPFRREQLLSLLTLYLKPERSQPEH